MIEWLVAFWALYKIRLIWIVILAFIIRTARKLWKKFQARAYRPPEQGIGRCYSEIIELPFKQIQNIHRLNSERLRFEYIETGYATYTTRKYLVLNYSEPQVAWEYYRPAYGKVRNIDHIVAVAMTPIEAIKFDYARKHKPNRIHTEEAILKAMQGDIDRLREKAQAEVDQAKEITERVARSMNNG